MSGSGAGGGSESESKSNADANAGTSAGADDEARRSGSRAAARFRRRSMEASRGGSCRFGRNGTARERPGNRFSFGGSLRFEPSSRERNGPTVRFDSEMRGSKAPSRVDRNRPGFGNPRRLGDFVRILNWMPRRAGKFPNFSEGGGFRRRDEGANRSARGIDEPRRSRFPGSTYRAAARGGMSRCRRGGLRRGRNRENRFVPECPRSGASATMGFVDAESVAGFRSRGPRRMIQSAIRRVDVSAAVARGCPARGFGPIPFRVPGFS